MTDKLVILTSVDKEELAERIATALVERQQAACVNVLPMGLSTYRWKEKIHRDREYLLLIKTAAHLFNEVRDTIRELHSYDLPEVIALPIAVGDEKVLEWIASSVKPRTPLT
ncbi:MAG: divalent-cation tolerance protein CutA [Candidatus Polarisedimenticolia bacterium]